MPPPCLFRSDLAVVLRSSNTTPFWATKKVVQTCAYCACAVRILPLFAYVWWLCSRCLPNPCQSYIWWLTTARRNSYQPRTYLSVSTVTNPSWRRGFLSWRVEYASSSLKTLLSGWSFLFMDNANCGTIAVIASMTIVSSLMNTLLLLWNDDDSHWSRHN